MTLSKENMQLIEIERRLQIYYDSMCRMIAVADGLGNKLVKSLYSRDAGLFETLFPEIEKRQDDPDDERTLKTRLMVDDIHNAQADYNREKKR